MEIISNEEKAEQIAQYHCANKLSLIQAYNSALDMAEWKDEQFAKEKQQIISNAVDWLNKYLFYLDKKDDIINNCIKAMKGE
jgi:hypothetical protein